MQKTYYKQLKEDFKIPEYLEIFKTDFTKHDKKALFKYNGDFILSARPTGTNLVKFIPKTTEDPKKCEDCLYSETCINQIEICENFKDNTVQKQKETFDLWILGIMTNEVRNKRFFYGKNGKITEISIEKAKEIFESYNNQNFNCKFYC